MYSNGYRPADAFAVTPSDDTELALDGFYVGGAGVVNVVTEKGTETPFTCAAGTTIALGIRKIKSTSTTATLIVGYRN